MQPNWEHMAYKAEDLQARFKEYSMPKHWLPPSIIPILKILIYEHKNRLEDQERKGIPLKNIVPANREHFRSRIRHERQEPGNANRKDVPH